MSEYTFRWDDTPGGYTLYLDHLTPAEALDMARRITDASVNMVVFPRGVTREQAVAALHRPLAFEVVW